MKFKQLLQPLGFTVLLLAPPAAMLAAADADAASTTIRLVGRHTAVFTQPPKHLPTQGMPDGPLLGNGDVGVALAGPPEAPRFHVGKNDFWRRNHADASVMAVGVVGLFAPALQGATYHQEQDLARAEVRGTFVKDGLTQRTRSWVDANENLLVTTLRCEGNAPLAISVRQTTGAQATAPARIADNGARLNIGRELHGGGRWYFDGVIDDVRVWNGGLSAEEIRRASRGETVAIAPVLGWPANTPDDTRITGGEATDGKVGRTIRFDGMRVFVDLAVPRLEKVVTVAAWIKIESTSKEANYIASKGEWNQAYSLGLSNGRLRWSVGGTFVETEHVLELHRWVHVAGTFDGQRMRVYVDGGLKKSLGDDAGGGTVEEPLAMCWFTRKADTLPGRSREVAVATRILGATARADGDGRLQFTLKPGETVAVVSSILSDLDAPGFLAAAKQRVAALQPNDLETLSAGHQKWWADFWARSFIEIPDQEIEKRWYVIYNDSIHEGSGQDMNPLLSLGLVRTLFKNLLTMSADLGVDVERRAKWQDIGNRISAFPLQERGGKTVFRYSEKGTAWWNDNTLGIQHIFPGGAIGLDSDPKLLEICHNTIAAMSRWHDNNGFSSWYTACARVGYDPKAILANLRKECDQRSYPNLLLYYGGGGIENVAGFLAVNEMLLQSHEGVLRFFPVWPKELNARFGSLRAVGAFLVSAEWNDGKVSGVKIHSEKGRACTVQNPWPGRKVQLVRRGAATEFATGDRFTFKTAEDETVELKP